MTVEQRLREALADEADALDVDLTALYVATRELARSHDDGTSPARNRSHARGLVAACVTLLLLGGVTGIALVTSRPDDRAGGGMASAADGDVEKAFACPDQRVIRFGESTDDSFLPDLSQGPAAAARLLRAPRWDLRVDGDRAVLLLGNGDGSLASRTELVLGDDGWRPAVARVCQGHGSILLPDPGADSLGRHDVPAFAAGRPLRAEDVTPDAVEIDLRAYFDSAGLVRQRSVWAAPCGDAVCVDAGERGSYVAATVGPQVGAWDLTTAFLPPDEMVGKEPPHTFVAVPDLDDRVTSVTWTSADGTVTEVPSTTGEGWRGCVFFLLVPAGELAGVSVSTDGGGTTEWTPEQLLG